MAKANSKGMYPNGRSKGRGQFTMLLHSILDHDDYKALSKSARAFLWDLSHQYNGGNNGNLAASEGVMGKFGYTRFQCCRLRKELENREWIEVTRLPRARRDPILYRLAWMPCDEWKGPPFLDVGAHDQKTRKLR